MKVSNCKIFYECTGIKITDVYPSECVILCVSFEGKAWLYLYIYTHVICDCLSKNRLVCTCEKYHFKNSIKKPALPW